MLVYIYIYLSEIIGFLSIMLCSVVGSKSESHLVVLGSIFFQGSGFNLLSSQDFFIFPSLVLLQYFCNNSAVLPQYFCSTSTVLLPYLSGTLPVLLGYFRFTSVVLPRYYRGQYFCGTSILLLSEKVLPWYFLCTTAVVLHFKKSNTKTSFAIEESQF